MILRYALAAGLAAVAGFAQLNKIGEQIGQLGRALPITELKLRTDPAEAKVRPHESVVVQIRAYGQAPDKTAVRLRRTGAKATCSGGWVSKAFAWQAEDSEKYFEERSGFWSVFQSASAQYVVKDAVLYTAPEQPGTYKVEAELEGVKASIDIEVVADAPSRLKPEKQDFKPEERGTEPFRSLAERYAPFIAQETWWQPKSDIPTRFDFDGDWNGDNNWDNLDDGTSQAYVHYTVMETPTHWFVIYNIFHPRDYSDRCVAGTCHENDNEGLILTVRKDDSEFGKLEAMETLAHNNVYSFTANQEIRGGLHDVDGGIELHEETHPVVFIESGGHGIYGSMSTHSRFDYQKGEFLDSSGMTLLYKGVAERPKHPGDRNVGYDLLPMLSHWWPKGEAGKWKDRTFDAFFSYEPFGNRPGLKIDVGGSFYGRKQGENKAKPFWGWHDTKSLKSQVLAVGQWALDPAYAVSRNLRFPDGQPFSLDYVFNPYLGFGDAGIAPPAEVTPVPVPEEAASGAVEITAMVDGIVDITIQGNSAQFGTKSGQPASGTNAEFTAAIPGAPLKSIRAAKRSGRGAVSLVEVPSEGNGYRAVIRVSDPKGGSAPYRVRVEWER